MGHRGHLAVTIMCAIISGAYKRLRPPHRLHKGGKQGRMVLWGEVMTSHPASVPGCRPQRCNSSPVLRQWAILTPA